MSHKTRAKGLLQTIMESGSLPGGVTFYVLLAAIIDALPEEPQPLIGACTKCGRKAGTVGGYCAFCADIFVPVGPEPVEVKESQPTSDWHRVYQMAKELMQLSEVRPVSELDPKDGQCSDLGPQQPPNVASGATQPPIDQIDAAHAMGFRQGAKYMQDSMAGTVAEDARKLRIMKAMEDHCAKHKDATFSCYYGDQWALITKGPPSCANFDFWKTQAEIDVAYEESERKIRARKEEQRIDKEIAEVKAEEMKCGFCGKPIPAGALYSRMWSDCNKPSFPIHLECPKDEPEAEKLWEGDVLLDKYNQIWHDGLSKIQPGWRRIKVKEVRGE